MGDALVHRGPDGSGQYISGRVGFAHRRLAIIDPIGGAQPLIDPQSGHALVFNGEVYNYIEIRRDLGDVGFNTASDTEVVLRAYRCWGIGCLARFRGMFAFALYDARAGKLFLVRDRLGIKPLYYHADSKRIAFASELGALVQSGLVPLKVDRKALAGYLRYGYVQTPAAIYTGVRKLEPGCYLEIDMETGAIANHRYWQLEPAIRDRDEDEALEELNAVLTETIRLYVRSDVPFGVFLSGGVDSSLVTALMAQSLAQSVRSFSAGFAEENYSELPFAAEASRIIGTSHKALVVSPEMSRNFLERLARRFGEPFADSSAIPTFYVAQLAAAEVKMVLSGDGGDEVFGGYNSYAAVFNRLEDTSLRTSFFSSVARVAGASRLGRFAAARAQSWQAIHHAQRDTFAAVERDRLMGEAAPPVDGAELSLPETADPVTRCQYRDLHTYLLDDILAKVDRMSMENSLEVRVPLLDHKLIEFAFTLPLSLKLRRDPAGTLVRKYLLKRSAERFFSRPFLERPKWGFGIPLRAWVDGPLKPLVLDLLDREPGRLGDHLDVGEVRGVVRDYYRGRADRIAQVWNLLSLRLWLEGIHAVNPSQDAPRPLPVTPVSAYGQI